jgi:hypothetical protein
MESNLLNTTMPAVPTSRLERPGFSFDAPQGASLAEFATGETAHLRLIVTQGGVTYRVEVEKWAADSAKAAAEQAFKSADKGYADQNLAPHPLALPGLEAWRMRKRFVDGFTAGPLNDAAFLQKGAAVYRLSYSASLEAYPAGLWLFAMVVKSFKIN